MISQPSLKPSIPSATLLRFLRSQFESLGFSRSPATANHSAGQRWPSIPHVRKFSRWTHEGTVPCEAAVNASLLPSHLNRRKTPNALPSDHDFSLTSPKSKSVSRQRSTVAGGKRHFLRRLLDFRHKKVESKLKPHDLPALSPLLEDGTEENLFNLGRSLAAKASNELRLRCTEFDGNGNVTLVNGEFRKSELIAKVCC